MVKVKFVFFALLAFGMLANNASSVEAGKLNGMWILDSVATERHFAEIPKPPHADKLAEWFMIVGGYMALFSYQFEGDGVVEDAYGGNGKKTKYQLLSKQGNGFQYKQTNVSAGAEVHMLSVSILEDGHLRIVKTGLEGMSYLLWKKSAVTNELVTKDEVMAAAYAWTKTMKNIVGLLSNTSNR